MVNGSGWIQAIHFGAPIRSKRNKCEHLGGGSNSQKIFAAGLSLLPIWISSRRSDLVPGSASSKDREGLRARRKPRQNGGRAAARLSFEREIKGFGPLAEAPA